MSFHHGFDEYQAEPDTFMPRPVGVIEPLEALKQARPVNLCNTVALVDNVAQDLLGRLLQP